MHFLGGSLYSRNGMMVLLLGHFQTVMSLETKSWPISLFSSVVMGNTLSLFNMLKTKCCHYSRGNY